MAIKNTSGGSNWKDSLLGLDGALSLDRKRSGELFSKHVNPGLKTMLSAIGFDKK
ncbi:MAG TPA: hypothetical protein GYA09_03155, partial [Firmicutes bacterium]|nr:hypothetical protein [Candidatus Fermentithermobacillaceae bacterium]